MAEKHILSKSTFLRGNQCLKSLYLYKHYYHLRDELSPALKAIFSRGSEVGVLAQDLFPGGVDASPESVFKFHEAVEQTQQYINRGEKIIYEAAFQYDRVLVAVDILVKKGDQWYAYEVKSSTRVSDVYRLDASLQYYVIVNAGIPLSDISIVHINNKYRRKGKLEIEKLFKKVSVLEDAQKNYKWVEKKIPEFKEEISKPAVPDIPIGPHCFEPYECDFMGHCWKNVPEHSVFEIAGMHKRQQFKMYHSGIKRIQDVPNDYSLRKDQRLQVEAAQTGTPRIDKTAIQKFLDKLEYPLYFFDIETFMPAIPLYDGNKPYEHLPFQYSLHLKQSREAELQHFEFLAEAGIDPRKSFTDNFLKHTAGEGSILVYNRQFEVGVLNKLAKHFPQHKKALEERISRVVDLMAPFREKAYYHPDMRGSYSIKAVLPALVPELSHRELDISEGSMAMAAFENLQNETDLFKIAEVRTQLLEYCKLDTLAMVKILEVLEDAASGEPD